MELTDELAEYVLDRISEGFSQVEIARAFSIHNSTLSRAIDARIERTGDGEAQRFARARAASAESWLDKGVAALERAALKSSDYDPQTARAIAQECARRAAIRNPTYRDKADVTLANPPGETLRTATLTPAQAAAIYKQTMG